MTLRGPLVAGSFVLLALAGELHAADGTRHWTGNFSISRHGAQISPCASGKRLAVEDATAGRLLAALYRELAPQPGKPIFVDFSGTETDGRVRAEKLHRASRDGPGCRERLADVRLVALGAEPFWRLEAHADYVRLYRFRVAPTLDLPAGSFIGREGEYRYEVASAEHAMQVRVRPGACRDAMSDGYFDHVVEVQIDSVTLKGCAYWGDLGLPAP